MIKRILNFINRAPKVTNDIMDPKDGHLAKLGQWVGMQQFTEEEKAIHNQKAIDAVHTYSVATLSENTDRSKTRRDIAVEWFRLQIWLIKLTVLFILIDYLVIKLAKGSEYELTEVIMKVSFSPMLWGITGAVSVFFFGHHALRSTKFAKDN